MGRKVNDGDKTGLKQDRFRNSELEYREDRSDYSGASRRSPNTLGGAYQENRGRRSADTLRSQWESSPFDDGRLENWNHRKGWDKFYDQSYDRGYRSHGGALVGHDQGHRGKGPKGYKRSDDSIYQDVCDTLSLSAEVDASEIEVNVKGGIVFLNGTVKDRGMKKMAELEIENISGVQDVQNFLTFRNTKEDLH